MTDSASAPPTTSSASPPNNPRASPRLDRRTRTLALHRVHAPRSSPNRYNARPVRPAAINQNTTIQESDPRASPRPRRPRSLFGVTIAIKVIAPDLAQALTAMWWAFRKAALPGLILAADSCACLQLPCGHLVSGDCAGWLDDGRRGWTWPSERASRGPVWLGIARRRRPLAAVGATWLPPCDDGLAAVVVIGRRTCPCCRGERPDPGRDTDCRAAARGSTTAAGCHGWHRASRGPMAAVPR